VELQPELFAIAFDLQHAAGEFGAVFGN